MKLPKKGQKKTEELKIRISPMGLIFHYFGGYKKQPSSTIKSNELHDKIVRFMSNDLAIMVEGDELVFAKIEK